MPKEAPGAANIQNTLKQQKEKTKQEASTRMNRSTRSVRAKKRTPGTKEKERTLEQGTPNRKWTGEEAANKFLDQISGAVCRTEFEELSAMPTPLLKCKVWAANKPKNRNEGYPCLDENRVVLQNCTNDYINASKVQLPNFPQKMILAQLPINTLPGAVEEFWRMIFHEGVTSVHIMCMPYEGPRKFGEFFPPTSGTYEYYGQMFVNNRKADIDEKALTNTYTIEVLPDGCSNSLLVQLHQHLFWPALSGPRKYAPAIRAAQSIFTKNEPTLLVSMLGSGRTGTLLAISVCLYALSKGIEPKVKEIVKAIREQRPMAVDSAQQYGFIYLTTCYYIKKKLPTDEVAKKVARFNSQCEENIKSE